jgi:hypothetical protein
MIRDFFITLAEALFWFTGGEPLATTVWFLVWVFGGALIMTTPTWVTLHQAIAKSPYKWISGVISFVVFFTMLMTIIGTPLMQIQMMEECLPVETQTVANEQGFSTEVRVRQCRFKDNFYGEFGEWQLRTVNR